MVQRTFLTVGLCLVLCAQLSWAGGPVSKDPRGRRTSAVAVECRPLTVTSPVQGFDTYSQGAIDIVAGILFAPCDLVAACLGLGGSLAGVSPEVAVKCVPRYQPAAQETTYWCVPVCGGSSYWTYPAGHAAPVTRPVRTQQRVTSTAPRTVQSQPQPQASAAAPQPAASREIAPRIVAAPAPVATVPKPAPESAQSSTAEAKPYVPPVPPGVVQRWEVVPEASAGDDSLKPPLPSPGPVMKKWTSAPRPMQSVTEKPVAAPVVPEAQEPVRTPQPAEVAKPEPVKEWPVQPAVQARAPEPPKPEPAAPAVTAAPKVTPEPPKPPVAEKKKKRSSGSYQGGCVPMPCYPVYPCYPMR